MVYPLKADRCLIFKTKTAKYVEQKWELHWLRDLLMYKKIMKKINIVIPKKYF